MAESPTGTERRRVPRTLLSEVSYKLFGKVSRVKSTQVTCNIKTGVLVPHNPNRISMILSNNSDTDIRIGFNSDVSSTNGLLLAANGGTFKMKVRDDGEMVIHELYAKCGADGKICTLIESELQEG
jgi:hypothetical protein